MSESIEVVAAVAKVATLADNGLRVTLDLPEDAVEVAAWLMRCKQRGVAIALAMVGIEPSDKPVERWTETRTG